MLKILLDSKMYASKRVASKKLQNYSLQFIHIINLNFYKDEFKSIIKNWK